MKIGEIDFGKQETTYEECQMIWRTFPSFPRLKSRSTFSSPPFSVFNDLWSLKLDIKYMMNRCILQCKTPRDYSVEFSITFEHLGGRVEHFDHNILLGEKPYCAVTTDGFSTDIFEIICTLRRDITRSTESTPWDERKPVKFISLDRLSQNLHCLFYNKETCDTTLKVKDKDYKAHRAILIAQSPVFAAMFTHDTLERQTGIINIPDCDPDTFQEFLDYLYSGKLEEISFPNSLHLYVTSHKYEVRELKTFCVEYLKQCFSVETFCEIVVFAEKYGEIELFSASQDFFNENVQNIFESSEWECLLKTDFCLANKLLKEMIKVKH